MTALVVCVPRIKPVAAPAPVAAIYDDFNRPNYPSAFNPASDGGTWTRYAQASTVGNPSVDPDRGTQIENNKAALVFVEDPAGANTTIFGQISRLLPGTAPEYEFSIDITRGRDSGAVTLYLGTTGPRISQNGNLYEFRFSPYTQDSRISNKSSFATSPILQAEAVPGWTSGTRRFTCRRQGAVLSLIVDGVTLITWTDPSPLPDTRWAIIDNQDYLDRFDNFNGGPITTMVTKTITPLVQSFYTSFYATVTMRYEPSSLYDPAVDGVIDANGESTVHIKKGTTFTARLDGMIFNTTAHSASATPTNRKYAFVGDPISIDGAAPASFLSGNWGIGQVLTLTLPDTATDTRLRPQYEYDTPGYPGNLDTYHQIYLRPSV